MKFSRRRRVLVEVAVCQFWSRHRCEIYDDPPCLPLQQNFPYLLQFLSSSRLKILVTEVTGPCQSPQDSLRASRHPPTPRGNRHQNGNAHPLVGGCTSPSRGNRSENGLWAHTEHIRACKCKHTDELGLVDKNHGLPGCSIDATLSWDRIGSISTAYLIPLAWLRDK